MFEIFSKKIQKSACILQKGMVLYLRSRERKQIAIRNIEAWLSLVERCVRDAEVAGSNPVASIIFWLVGQAVKTPPSHGGNRGSIPLRAIKRNASWMYSFFVVSKCYLKNRILLRRILRLRRLAKRQILFRRNAIHAERSPRENAPLLLSQPIPPSIAPAISASNASATSTYFPRG